MKDESPKAQMARMTRRSLLWSAAAVGGAYGVWRWLLSGRSQEGLPPAFRSALRLNESLWSKIGNEARLSPTFPKSAAETLRVNGRIGLAPVLAENLDAFRVSVESANHSWTRVFAAIRQMPKVDVVTEHRCIEGWSNVVHWSGVRLIDFLVEGFGGIEWLVGSEGYLYKHLFVATPDRKYYVSLDMAAALHPQTLLAWELNGEPLSADHGAPVRLVVPTKYGIKSLKRVGVLRLANEEPKDYWRERAYDGFAGL